MLRAEIYLIIFFFFRILKFYAKVGVKTWILRTVIEIGIYRECRVAHIRARVTAFPQTPVVNAIFV